MAAGRAREKIKTLLKGSDIDLLLAGLDELPVHRAVRYLLSLLNDTDEGIKGRAAAALGVMVARVAEQDMEPAREVMRRLMWSLNHESGSIGWGSLEAMAEIMVNHEGLAREYVHMLISYMSKDGNYLEHVLLQQALVRALGRLARARPGLLCDKGVIPGLQELSRSEDAAVRSQAVQCLAALSPSA